MPMLPKRRAPHKTIFEFISEQLLKKIWSKSVNTLPPHRPSVTSRSIQELIFQSHFIKAFTHYLTVVPCYILFTANSNKQILKILIDLSNIVLQIFVSGFSSLIILVCKPTRRENANISELIGIRHAGIQCLDTSHRQSCQCAACSVCTNTIVFFNERDDIV